MAKRELLANGHLVRSIAEAKLKSGKPSSPDQSLGHSTTPAKTAAPKCFGVPYEAPTRWISYTLIYTISKIQTKFSSWISHAKDLVDTADSNA